MRRYSFPEKEGVFIDLPDHWQGRHLLRYQEAGSKLEDSKLPVILANFTRHIAILENWNLDGVNGNPAHWEMEKVDLRQVLWVNALVGKDFNDCFIVPKDWLSPLQSGQAETVTTM